MSVREEDRQNKNCPSRGLGLAAAAIGVGVGAALYYFFSKRPENPNEEGSTSTWECEQAQAFTEDEFEGTRQENHSDDSYTTLSEHSTTDTSIHTSPFCGNCHCNDYESSQNNSYDDDENACYISDDDDEIQSNDSMMSSHMSSESASSVVSDSEIDSISSESEETAILETDDSMTYTDFNNDWNIVNSSSDIPRVVMQSNSNLTNIFDIITCRNFRNGRGVQ